MAYRATVQKPSNPDRKGVRQTFEDVATIWCSIRQMKASEKVAGNQVVTIGDYEIRLWGIPELVETWRLLHGNHIYNFGHVDQPNLLSREIVIMAKRIKNAN